MGYAKKLTTVVANCKCAKCGKSFTRTAQKAGKAAATSWMYWAQNTFTTCPDCFRAQKRNEELEDITAEMKRLNFPALNAVSPRQLSYAESIRIKVMRRYRKDIDFVKTHLDFPEDYAAQSFLRINGASTFMEGYEALARSGRPGPLAIFTLMNEANASAIIDKYKEL